MAEPADDPCEPADYRAEAALWLAGLTTRRDPPAARNPLLPAQPEDEEDDE